MSFAVGGVQVLRNVREQWREISLEKKLTMFVAPVFVAVVSGILIAVFTGALSGSSPGGKASESAQPSLGVPLEKSDNLEVLDVSVADDRAVRVKPPAGDPGPSFKDFPPYVDITVRNVGDAVAVVTHVAFRIRQFGFIPICQAGGGLGPSERYDMTLPTHPHRGQVVETASRVSQVIRPNEADRFTIRVNVPNRDAQFATFLYQLEVLIYQAKGVAPVSAGLALVVAPTPPYAPWRVRPKAESAAARFPPFSPAWPSRSFENAGVSYGACVNYNQRTMNWFLKLKGARPPNLPRPGETG